MKTLLCFGDSNTHGTAPMASLLDRRRYDRATRWPGVCQATLGPDWHVIEEGHPGRTSTLEDPTAGPHRAGVSILPALLESHQPLDLVAIMIGTNDLKMCHGMSPLDIALAVERLVLTVRHSPYGPDRTAPAVLLIAPVPILERGWLAEMYAGGAAKAARLPPYLSEVAERNGAAFLDAGSIAQVDPEEGIHLPETAHAAIGRAVAEVTQTLFPTQI